jgi:hypothetical protein
LIGYRVWKIRRRDVSIYLTETDVFILVGGELNEAKGTILTHTSKLGKHDSRITALEDAMRLMERLSN